MSRIANCAGRDALLRVRRCKSRRSFLLLLHTHSCAFRSCGSLQKLLLFYGWTFLVRAAPDRAGARLYPNLRFLCCFLFKFSSLPSVIAARLPVQAEA